MFLAQDTSMSRSRSVAEFFLADQGRKTGEGTLFEVAVDLLIDRDVDKPVQARFADLSWISKFPDEQETLVHAGTAFKIDGITLLSDQPRVERVQLTVVESWHVRRLGESPGRSHSASGVRACSL